MENDVLGNKIAPWQAKGRWYKCRIKYNTVTSAMEFIQNETDPNFSGMTAGGNYVQISREGEKVIDLHAIIDVYETSATTGYVAHTLTTNALRLYYNKREMYVPFTSIPAEVTALEMTIWVFKDNV